MKCFCGKTTDVGKGKDGNYRVKCPCGLILAGYDSKKEAKSDWMEYTKILTIARKDIPPTEWQERCI